MENTDASYMVRRFPYRVSVYLARYDQTFNYDADALPDGCAIVAAGATHVVVYRGPHPRDQAYDRAP